jgi:hypothetical protein
VAAFGLYTHIAANRRRSVALVVGLFVLVYVLTFAFALLFRALEIGPPVPGGAVQDYLRAAARDLLWLSPLVTAATALWVWTARRFHQGIIDAVTGSGGVAREEDPRLYNLLENLCIARGLPVPRLIFGGTPTFPVHAAADEPGLECSPGTCVLHDSGYASTFPDLPFVPAAVLLTRVISRPRPGRLCLDLGHKAVAADPPGARLTLLGVPDATLGGQSEEHLVVDTPHAHRFPPGTPLLALPTHICPTCAMHRQAYVVEGGRVTGQWDIAARDRV